MIHPSSLVMNVTPSIPSFFSNLLRQPRAMTDAKDPCWKKSLAPNHLPAHPRHLGWQLSQYSQHCSDTTLNSWPWVRMGAKKMACNRVLHSCRRRRRHHHAVHPHDYILLLLAVRVSRVVRRIEFACAVPSSACCQSEREERMIKVSHTESS